MQAAATRGRGGSPSGNGADKALDPETVASEVDRRLAQARQAYLDALPIAAAIIVVGDGEDSTEVDCANEHFRFVSEWDERMGDRRVSHVPILRTGPIGARLGDFIRSDDPACSQPNGFSFGNPIGGIRPAAPRAVRQGFMSGSVRVRPLSPPIGQDRPSATRKVAAPARPPSR